MLEYIKKLHPGYIRHDTTEVVPEEGLELEVIEIRKSRTSS